MTIELGIHLPNITPLDGTEPTRRIAQLAEQLGFDSLWSSDNVAVPLRGQHPYSYSANKRHPVEPEFNLIDPLISLTVAAGCTERIALGTTVLVLPYRNPVLTAKAVASIEMLTGRRIFLGVGIGGGEERWEILNLPGYRERGKVTDEYIEVMRQCWEEETSSFAGRYYTLEPSTLSRSRRGASQYG
jgi:alkanesulfonate monooxygenase SsuD/methylene tetrahydromethanopterin reductase-like flavin-dependent oxidoreductase (luciferase family)